MRFLRKLKRITQEYRLDLIIFFTLVTIIGSSGFEKNIKEIAGSIGLIIIISSIIFLPHRALAIFHTFIFKYQNRTLKKVAGTLSLLSWLVFGLTYIVLPLGFVFTGRLLFLTFILLTLAGGILTFYDLEKNGNLSLRKIRLTLWFFLPLCFILTNALASSYFTQFSALSISSVPYTEFIWKFVFSIMALALLLQPVSYLIFITQADKTEGYQTATLIAFFLAVSVVLFAIPHWGANILSSVLDHATRFEWRDEAKCGKLIIKREDERYFGFNSDKYTLYFSNPGYWGFYELNCAKDKYNNDTFRLTAVDIETRKPWFGKDSVR
ncbi:MULTISPECIES: hypothetical protein [Pantoea]|uniref:hypothetical protein n=1 Tax=Pantoea TaxID=53335 RepID=UPI001F36E69E|nr:MULTISPECIES: hypothetical protein [Pantoea]UIL51992.1 hypothetical protein LZU96_17490 [Pantoea agglomerans]